MVLVSLEARDALMVLRFVPVRLGTAGPYPVVNL